MTLFDQFSNVLKQYSGGSTPDATKASEHFDQVAQTATLRKGFLLHFARIRHRLLAISLGTCSASRMENRKLGS